jgi:hypothetical protein
MAAEQLQIQVQANVQQAITGLNTLNAQLDNTSAAATELGAKSLNILNNQLQRLQRIAANPNLSSEQYKRLGDLIKNTAKEADTLSKSLKVLNTSQGQLKSGTGQANVALVNFGRVVQDAPFGLIGIANNIDPLLSSFQQLRKETGSNATAFKALASSLSGPAGLAIAVSSITSLFIAFGPQISNFFLGISSTEKAIQDISGASAESFRKAQIEFGRLSDVITNSSSSYTQQKDALDKINSSLKEYGVEITNVAAFQKNAATIGILYSQIKAEEARNTALAAASAKAYAEELQAQNKTQKFAGQETLLKNLPFIGSQLVSLIPKLQKFNAESTKENAAESQKAFNQALTESNTNLNSLLEQLRGLEGVKPLEDGKKSVDEITELLKKYREEIKGISWEEQTQQISLVDEKIKTANDTLKNLYIKNVKESSKAWQEVNNQLQGFLLDKKFNDFSKVIQKINSEVSTQAQTYKSSQKVFEQSNKESLKIADENLKKIIANAKFRELLDKENIKRQKELADTISGFVTPAVDNLIDAFASGEDPFEALQQSVKGLIVELTKLIAKQLIYNAISTALNLAAPGAGSALGVVKTRGDFLLSAFTRAGTASDERLKDNIVKIGVSKSGLNIYQFTYIDMPDFVFIGVMAQDLLGTKHEKALSKEGKYYKVDYSLLDVQFKIAA